MARSFKKTLLNTLSGLLFAGLGLSALAGNAEAKSKMTLKELKATYGVPHSPDAKHAAVNALETKLLKQGVAMPSNDRTVYMPELVEQDPGRLNMRDETVVRVTATKGKGIIGELKEAGVDEAAIKKSVDLLKAELAKRGDDSSPTALTLVLNQEEGYVVSALLTTTQASHIVHFGQEGAYRPGAVLPLQTTEVQKAHYFRLIENAQKKIEAAKNAKHMAAHAKAAKKKVQKAKSAPEAQSTKVEAKAPATAAPAAGGVNATGVNATHPVGMNATGAAPSVNATVQGNATNATSLYSREELEKFHNAAKNATKQAKMRELIEVITNNGTVYPIDSNLPKTPVLRNVPSSTNATNSSSGYVPFPNG